MSGSNWFLLSLYQSIVSINAIQIPKFIKGKIPNIIYVKIGENYSTSHYTNKNILYTTQFTCELVNNIDDNFDYLLYETQESQKFNLNVKNNFRISIYDIDGNLLEPSLPEYCYPRKSRKEIQINIDLNFFN